MEHSLPVSRTQRDRIGQILLYLMYADKCYNKILIEKLLYFIQIIVVFDHFLDLIVNILFPQYSISMDCHNVQLHISIKYLKFMVQKLWDLKVFLKIGRFLAFHGREIVKSMNYWFDLSRFYLLYYNYDLFSQKYCSKIK